MGKNIFITGASGFLGRNMLEVMLTDSDDDFHLLCRSDRSVASLKERFVWANPSRLSYVRGDVTKPYLGVHGHVRSRLKEDIDEVWHMAASTSFDESKREQIESTNIFGTQNLVTTCKSFKKIKNLFYMSTSYVCGNEQGVIPEEPLNNGSGYKNPYEESKLECERIVRGSKLPFTIIRPSIIVGNSVTGDAEGESRMVYGYLLAVYYSSLYDFEVPRDKKFWEHWKSSEDGEYREIRSRFRANGNTTKNLVTLDDVIGVCQAIRKNGRNIGKTYNVINSKNITVKEIVDTMQETLHVKGIEYIPNLPREEIRGGTTSEMFAYKGTKPYWPYVHVSEPHWEDKNVKALGVKRVEMNLNLLNFLISSYVNKYLKPK